MELDFCYWKCILILSASNENIMYDFICSGDLLCHRVFSPATSWYLTACVSSEKQPAMLRFLDRIFSRKMGKNLPLNQGAYGLRGTYADEQFMFFKVSFFNRKTENRLKKIQK